MAVVMMGGDEKKPIFHDFLGMSCGDSIAPVVWMKRGENRGFEVEVEAEASVGGSSGGQGLVSGSSDLGSEKQGASNSEVFHFHARNNALSGPEASNSFSGRKRSNSDSVFMGLIRDKMLPVGSDSSETSRLMKMFGKDVVGERLGRMNDGEMPFSMQPPPRPTSSLILHPPVSSRPDSLISKWERSVPVNPGSLVHYPSRFGLSGTHVDKLSSSYIYKDANATASIISQAAADEGSRTGIKGSGLLKVFNSSSGAVERNVSGALPSSSRAKPQQIVEPESSSVPSRQSLASASRQMTIFYAGQAHVFDDVHPNKADVIMALAGSNGGSWSTTYSPKSGIRPPVSEARAASGDNEMRTNNIPVSIPGISDHGLTSQVARIPFASDLQSLTPGRPQGGKIVRDTRVTPPAAQRDMEEKRDV